MKKLFIFIFSYFIICSAFGQEYNYARISLLYGGDIPFNFNSIEKYRNGIEILDGTIIGITLADSAVGANILEGFDLNIRTFNSAAVIRGDVNNLSLDKIRVKAEDYLGLSDGTSYGYLNLSGVWVTLFSYSVNPFTDLRWDNHQLSISYECGSNGSLLGEEPDYYTVELEIEIVPTGWGF